MRPDYYEYLNRGFEVDTILIKMENLLIKAARYRRWKEPNYRARISPEQIHHFVDYISRPDIVKDVAFCTKTLELSSGDTVVILAVSLTMIPSRIIDSTLTIVSKKTSVSKVCFE